MDVVQQVEYIKDISRISEIRVVNICYLLVCVEDNNCDGGYECIDGTCRYLKIMKVTDLSYKIFSFIQRPPPCHECLDENNIGVCDVEKIDREKYTTCSFCQNQTCVKGTNNIYMIIIVIPTLYQDVSQIKIAQRTMSASMGPAGM